MSTIPWWSSESLWRKIAIRVTAGLRDRGWKWKWSLALLNIGVVGMTIALLIAGYEQSFIERAVGGSTWSAFFEAQSHPWFVQTMHWLNIFGWVTGAGLVLLFWDFFTIGRGEERSVQIVSPLREQIA